MSFRQIIVVFVLLRSINYKCEGRLIKTVLLNYFFFFTFNCFNLYLGTRTAHCPSKSTNKIKKCELSTMFWNVVLLFHSADISFWNNCSFNAAQSTVLTSGWPKPLCNLANSGENSPSNEKKAQCGHFSPKGWKSPQPLLTGGQMSRVYLCPLTGWIVMALYADAVMTFLCGVITAPGTLISLQWKSAYIIFVVSCQILATCGHTLL